MSVRDRIRQRIRITGLEFLVFGLALLLSWWLSPKLRWIPDITIGQGAQRLSGQDLLATAVALLLSHGVFSVIAVFRASPLWARSLAETILELRFMFASIALSMLGTFLAAVATFSTRFFVLVFTLTSVLYLSIMSIASAVAGNGSKSAAPRRAWLDRWTVVTVGILSIAASFFVAYKHHLGFRNTINYIRASFYYDDTPGWGFAREVPEIDLDQPMQAAFLRADASRCYLLERPGRLIELELKSSSKKAVLLDFRERVGSVDVENGALSFAFHPRFGVEGSEQSGHVYIYYSHVDASGQEVRLSRFDLSYPDLAQRNGSEEVLIAVPRNAYGLHNGGTVTFGPEGFLYLSIGDFADPDTPQQIDQTLASGIIRIDVDQVGGEISHPIRTRSPRVTTQGYYIPSSNPFVGQALEEFWALGFRNPFRMWIDVVTGDVWLGDVGWETYEEVNRVRAGANGMWPYKEGHGSLRRSVPKDILGEEMEPYYAYPQTVVERAVIGGLIYRGRKFRALSGRYVFADNQAGLLQALGLEEKKVVPLARTDHLSQYGITSIVESPEGDLYVTVLGGKRSPSGKLLKLEKREGGPLQEPVEEAASYASVREQYDMLCSRCHGLDGKGSSVPEFQSELDFTRAEWQHSRSDEFLREVILEGGAAAGIDARMPSWAGVFTEEELGFLVRRLRDFGTATLQPDVASP